MMKKLLTMGAVLVLSLSLLAGCGNSEADVNETETKTENNADVVVENEQPSDVVEENTEIETEVETETTPAYTFTDSDVTMYAKQSVNVRDLPTADGNLLGSLSARQEVHVTGQCNETGWYRIDYNGGVAYVSNSYLVDTKPEETQTAPAPETSGSKPNANEGYIVSREECPFPLNQVIETDSTITYYIVNADPVVDGKPFMDNAEMAFMQKHNVQTLYCTDYEVFPYCIDCNDDNCGVPHFVSKWTWSIYPPQ